MKYGHRYASSAFARLVRRFRERGYERLITFNDDLRRALSFKGRAFHQTRARLEHEYEKPRSRQVLFSRISAVSSHSCSRMGTPGEYGSTMSSAELSIPINLMKKPALRESETLPKVTMRIVMLSRGLWYALVSSERRWSNCKGREKNYHNSHHSYGIWS